MNELYTFITDKGREKLAQAITNGTQVMLKEFAIGDGNGSSYAPNPAQTALLNQVYRAGINKQSIDSAHSENILLELLIPENHGGWWIREVGIYDSDNELFAIAKYPPTYKPAVSDGAILKQLIIKFYLQVANAANVTLDITSSGNVATIEHIESILPRAASIDETIAGTINNKYVTPESLQAKKTCSTDILDNSIIDNKFITPKDIIKWFTESGRVAYPGYNNPGLIQKYPGGITDYQTVALSPAIPSNYSATQTYNFPAGIWVNTPTLIGVAYLSGLHTTVNHVSMLPLPQIKALSPTLYEIHWTNFGAVAAPVNASTITLIWKGMSL